MNSESQANGSPSAPPRITLPKGGGAIQGIGEKFSTNAMTGTGSLSVPLGVSPGRAGFGPNLNLTYESGAGNGAFGLGWELSLPSITRKTDKGIPRYLDCSESDVFILSGSEDLVPMDAPDEVRSGHVVKRYGPELKGFLHASSAGPILKLVRHIGDPFRGTTCSRCMEILRNAESSILQIPLTSSDG